MSAADVLETQTLELASGRKQVVEAAGEGPALLWLHGLSGVEAEDPLLRALTRGHRVLAPVAPGFNDVAELAALHDVHDLALHYDDILHALGIDNIPVVGHSFGALIAAELAAHAPTRVSRLVLLSPLGLWNDDQPVTDIFAVPYGELGALLSASPGSAGAESPASQRDVEEVVAVAQAMTAAAKFLWPIPDSGLRRRLYRIAAPTLVVFGELDGVVPSSYAREFASAIRHAASEVVPGAGHLVHIDQPDAVIELVTDFIDHG